MARKLWAGLDVGVETTSICVVDDKGNVVHEAVTATKIQEVHRELRFLKRLRKARVGLESGLGTTLARGLQSLGYCVDIYETRQLSKFLRLRRNKTDAGDALGIAEAGRLAASNVSKVYLKSIECQSLICRLTIRRHFIRSRVRAMNTLCRQVELFGGRIRPRISPANLRTEVDEAIREHFSKAPKPYVANLYDLLGQIEQLHGSQLAIDRDLKCIAEDNEVCRRMMEIPGVGVLCALTFYAVIEEPTRFAKNAKVGSYLGLAPRLHQSGLTTRIGRISKMGNKSARSLLVQSSMQFIRRCEPGVELHAWALRVAQRSGYNRARVALARKLAILMLAMWKNDAPYLPRMVEVSSTP